MLPQTDNKPLREPMLTIWRRLFQAIKKQFQLYSMIYLFIAISLHKGLTGDFSSLVLIRPIPQMLVTHIPYFQRQFI